MSKPETAILQDDDDKELSLYPGIDDDSDEREDVKTMWMLSGVVALSGIATLLL